MKPTQEEIRDFVNASLHEWNIYVVSVLKDSAKKKGLNVSEDTINSIKAQVLKASANDMAAVTISFLSSGRIKDMKVVTHTRPMPNDAIKNEIMKWVAKIGVSKFERVPGYKAGSFPSENIAIRRIAWGFGKGITKGKWVRKQWYAKRMAGTIKKLSEMLITDYQTVLLKSWEKQISGKQ